MLKVDRNRLKIDFGSLSQSVQQPSIPLSYTLDLNKEKCPFNKKKKGTTSRDPSFTTDSEATTTTSNKL